MSSGGGAAAGGGGGSGRVSIPNNVRKTIQNIKEITGNHSEEDIYAMLKECSMDPNETADKLLLQDPFHEVKRKRDRRKENLNKEPAESRWKSGQGRGSRGGRAASSSRNISHDAGGGRNLASGKENGPNQVLEKGVNMSSSATAQEIKSKDAISAASSSTANANCPTVVPLGNIAVTHDSQTSADSAAGKSEGLIAAAESKSQVVAPGSEDQSRQQVSGSSSSTAVQSSGGYFSTSDSVLLPSQDSQHPNAVGTIICEVGSQRTNFEQIPLNSDQNKSTSATDSLSSIMQGKLPSKIHGVGKNHNLESLQNATSVHATSSVSRPSSNYNNRSQVIGTQKVGPSKEWKPKSTNPNLAQRSGTAASSEAPAVAVEANAQLQPTSNSLDSKEANVELQGKLEELHISDGQYVIIPNHLHVPEVEKLGFCFGSFDASFGINTSHNSTPESDQSALSETTDGNEDAAGEQFSSNQNAFAAEEVDYPDNNQSASYVPENLSSNEGVGSSTVPEFNEPKQETAPGGNQYSVAHTSPNYSFGFMPPIIGNQLAPFEGSEAQVRDVSRLPTFVVQQPFDPTSYYAQFYRSSADSDGRVSPFHSAGVATKYNGNLAVVSHQTSQSSQEGNPLVLSTAAPTPIANQATGVLQSSMAVTQQPLSVFRPPTGLHLPHYPPNYIPYGHYISPFFVPPPAAIHQFLSNGAFPQQPHGGSVYPTPPAAAAKYSLPQYKPGTHTNNPSHVGVPGSYGPYGASLATAAGNSTSNEDLAASHFKESNVYASGQQSEGSGVWITPSGRDMSSLQASSFYNLPQGQMAFTPAQPGHGTFAGVYHPAQPVNATTHPLLQQSQAMAGPVDMVGPTGSVYQQPQHSQINWPSNF